MSSVVRRKRKASSAALLRKVIAIVHGHGAEGATSLLVQQSLPRLGKRQYDESDIKRVLSENSSKWLGHKPLLRTQSVNAAGETEVCYIAQEYVTSSRSIGTCYLSGEKRYPYQILASRFCQTKRSLLFQAALPLCIRETALRLALGASGNSIIRSGVVVVPMKAMPPAIPKSGAELSVSTRAPTTVSNVKEAPRSVRKQLESFAAVVKEERNKSGWLHKRGGNIFRKTWHRRYIRLTETDFSYFLSDRRNERARGSYILNKDCSVQHSSRDSSAEYPNTFRVKGKRFDLLFAAKSALEEQNWIDNIRKTIRLAPV